MYVSDIKYIHLIPYFSRCTCFRLCPCLLLNELKTFQFDNRNGGKDAKAAHG